ncbi:hypothetical protein BDP81DRAFT_419970 [Colletotrichum phormii]|uniref:Uncharacterized protein n=1 Tax=Colletotrichum phormii TaxID=359342 RepID=A0AAI9ZY55_9PEZI|nr:uncharacterized protein BDP81DRAFT_419970 [Colletotrichum phormii]KAK1640399.1 hypothetical protein BDP81DRAFT_419970 [Colletotrichum phormii]
MGSIDHVEIGLGQSLVLKRAPDNFRENDESGLPSSIDPAHPPCSACKLEGPVHLTTHARGDGCPRVPWRLGGQHTCSRTPNVPDTSQVPSPAALFLIRPLWLSIIRCRPIHSPVPGVGF